jgi:phosphotransferase system  glucose/maltose/N-acetylglucosamine-specific IIC component
MRCPLAILSSSLRGDNFYKGSFIAHYLYKWFGINMPVIVITVILLIYIGFGFFYFFIKKIKAKSRQSKKLEQRRYHEIYVCK